MSENLPKPQPSEEIDLGQLFKLIGNMFDRFFKFIGSIFNKLFLAFIWVVLFGKKHLIKVIIAGILGVIVGILMQKSTKPVFLSTMVIKQNYETGENLYNTLEYYNNLIGGRDSISLSRVFGISPKEAAAIVSLEVQSNLNENQKLQHFDKYIKSIDSTLANTLNYKEFLENSNDFEHEFQKLTLKARSNIDFDKILSQIVQNISSNQFYKNLQRKDSLEVSAREQVILESLEKSEDLQKVYREVLKSPQEKTLGGTTNITIEGRDNRNTTKEYELYNKDLVLRRELVDLSREKNDITYIIEIISNAKEKGTMESSRKMLGIKFSKTLDYGLFFIGAIILILLLLEFINYLEYYKNKISKE